MRRMQNGIFDRIHRISQSVQRRLESYAPQQAYKYSPLEAQSDAIRIVRLLPGAWDDPISIELVVRPLDGARLQPYEALSYVWGKGNTNVEKPSVSVVPSGKLITITSNLKEALQYLRHPEVERHLWIDALSINQQDDEEKGRQVQRMASIYEIAASVIAWIGKEDAQGSVVEAFRGFRQITKHVSVDWVLRELTPKTEDIDWCNKDLPLALTAVQLNAIAEMLKRSWWSRLWIWQEIQIGRDKAELMCGRQSISWKMVCDAVYVLRYKALPLHPSAASAVEFITSDPKVEYIYSLCDTVSLALLSALHRSRLAECTDARDRVYGILSLVRQSGPEPDIRPDYRDSNTQASVFTEAAADHLRTFSDLQPLLYVSGGPTMHRLPTWVPDWNIKKIPAPFSYVDAGPGEALGLHIRKSSLHVKGRLIATVSSVAAFRINKSALDDPRLPSSQLLYKTLVKMPDLLQAILNGDRALLQMLCRVVCGNRFSDRVVRDDGELVSQWPSLRECAATIMQDLTGKGRSSSLGHARIVHELIRHHCTDRVLFQSGKGRLGLAPVGTKPGHVVAVMPGCKATVVLQQAHFNRYYVVGAAYLDGYMFGEAVLGRLPALITSVIVLSSTSQSWEYGFRDETTRSVSYKDPRRSRGSNGKTTAEIKRKLDSLTLI